MTFEELLQRHGQEVNQVARAKAAKLKLHAAFRYEDAEDLSQGLFLVLCVKWPHFDARLSAPLTFASRIFDRTIRSWIRSSTAAKRDSRRTNGSLNAEVQNSDGDVEERARTLEESAARAHRQVSSRTPLDSWSLQVDVDDVLKRIPKELLPAVNALIEMSKTAAARQLGKSRRQVSNDAETLLEIFRDADLDQYL